MEFDTKIVNDSLVHSIRTMKAELKAEYEKLFEEELVKARLLMPVRPDPPAKGNGDEEGTKTFFPALTGKDGKKLLIVYTDEAALNAHDVAGRESTPEEFRENTAAVTFDELAAFVLGRDQLGNETPYMGFVLNPGTDNVIVGRDEIRALARNHRSRQNTPEG